MPVNVLDVEHVSVTHNGALAINDISFSVQEGDLLGVVGPNGAGKTTLFRAILGLQSYGGKIKLFGYEGREYSKLLPMVGYVPQKVNFEPNFPATVADVVSLGSLSGKKLREGARLIESCGCCWNRIFGESTKDNEKVDKVLEIVGLESLRHRRISELSGGEQQRTFIAKALVKEPVLMILDEPVTGVDMEVQNRFYSVIRRINKENRVSIVWASHDLTAISDHATKVACMNRDLFFHGEKEEFFSNEDLLKTYSESAMQMHMHDHGK
ncbi:MAG TPA: metal ABC transporter ATP-binding protein [Nitrososphaera sp.]|jgi:zinc transport system ATP-binding protein